MSWWLVGVGEAAKIWGIVKFVYYEEMGSA
jgi:hypothetical protein